MLSLYSFKSVHMLNLKKASLLVSICSCSLVGYASGSHDHAGHDHAGHDHGAHATEKVAPVEKFTVANVNGTMISNEELDVEVKRMSRGQQPGMPTTDEQKQQILDFMIGRILLVEQAAKMKVVVPPAEVEAEIEKIKARFPDEKVFISTLAQDGITPEALKKQISEGLLIQKVMEKNIVDSEVKAADVKGFYESNPQFFKTPEQVKASHILMKVKEDGSDKDAVTAQLKELKAEAEKDGDFAELAKKHSQGPSADNGGDLGFFGKGQMVPAFEKSAFTMKDNEVSDVIETQFGLHILKVYERRAGGVTPFAEVKEKIEGHLNNQNKGDSAKAYVDQLKAGADIKITMKKA
jgi:peptidyl-prolyl cis-trans isomerase C